MTTQEYQTYRDNQRAKKEEICEKYAKVYSLNGPVKIGLGVMAWEDSTHLRKILVELRPICDIIVIGWQSMSYTGNRLSQTTHKKMQDEFEKLLSDGLADEVIFIENISMNTFINENHKRNVLNCALGQRGAHVTLIADSDEVRFADDCLKIIENLLKPNTSKTPVETNYFACYTPVKTFVKNTSIEHPNKSNELMNSWCLFSSGMESPFVMNKISGIHTDLTRTFDKRFMTFVQSDAFCYHLSWIRPNIQEKIDAYSQPALLGESIDTLAEQLSKTPEELLERGYLNIDNRKYVIQKCSYPRLDEWLEVVEKF